MSLFKQVRGWLGSDSLDEALPASQQVEEGKPVRNTTRLMRVPVKKSAEAAEWWETIPGGDNPTVHFVGQDAELAKRVTMRVHTGRIHAVRLPEAMQVMVLLAARKELTPQKVAEVMVSAPDMPEAIIRHALVQAGCDATARPVSAEAWVPVLERCDLDELARELFTLVARNIYLGGPSAESDEANALWDHVLATAMVTDHFAHAYHFKHPHLAYITALLHDVGHAIVLWTLLQSLEEGHAPDTRLLTHLCRTLHEEAGLAVARFWRLPAPIAHIMGHHHQDLDPTDKLAPLQALVQLADESVLRCGHGAFETPRRKALLACDFAEYLKLSEEDAPKVLSEVPTIAIQATL